MELSGNTHHLFRILYHFVWIPKYRHRVFLEPYRTNLKHIIKKAAHDYEMHVDEIEIPEDHMHMLIQAEPKMSPSRIMQIIKSISAREFFKMHPDIKRKYFWGGKLWTQSFYVETVGNRNEQQVRKYVQDQLKAMDDINDSLRQLKLL
jgi:putative transposase